MSKNKSNVLFSKLKCPILITKDQAYEYMYKNNLNYREISFQLAIMCHDKNKGYILGATYDNEIVAIMIVSYTKDINYNKKWVIIRYLSLLEPDFEHYIIEKFIKETEKIAKKKKHNFIAYPSYIINEKHIFNYPFHQTLKESLLEHNYIKSIINVFIEKNNYDVIKLVKPIYIKENSKNESKQIVLNILNDDDSSEYCYNNEYDIKILEEVSTLNNKIKLNLTNRE